MASVSEGGGRENGVRKATRPSIPVLFGLLLGVYLGERAVLALGWEGVTWRAAVGVLVVLGLAAVVAPLTDLGSRIPWRSVLAGSMAGLVGLVLGAWGLGAMESLQDALSHRPVSEYTLVVTKDASEKESRWGGSTWRSKAEVWDGDARLGTVWLTTTEAVFRSEKLSGPGRFSVGEGDFALRNRSQLMAGTVTLVSITERVTPQGPVAWLRDLRQRILSTVDPSSGKGAALLAGAVFGQRDELDARGIQEEFSRAGLAHLVAVSGSHLAVVCALLAKTLERGSLGIRGRTLCLLGVSGLYVLLCGAPISAIRAWTMNGAAWGSALGGRRASPLAALGATGLGFCLLDPAVATDLGFVLSATSVGALILVGPWVRETMESVAGDGKWLGRHHRTRRMFREGRDSMAVALLCSGATVFAAAAAFGQVSTVGPVANLVVGPLFEPLVCLGVLGGSLAALPVVGPFLGAIPLGLGAVVGELACFLVGGLSRIPLACLPLEGTEPLATLGPLLLVGTLWLFWPKPRPRPLRVSVAVAGTVLLAVMVVGPWLQGPRVVVMDVGQGDAILLQDQGRALLMDAGVDEQTRSALGRAGVFRLDGLCITHQHDDHYGGLPSLAGFCALDRVLVAQGVADQLCDELRENCGSMGLGVEELQAGDVFWVGRFRCEVLWPNEPVDGTENGHSLMVKVEFEEGDSRLSLLLTGDGETEQLGEVLGQVGDIDVLKVGHHGSAIALDATQAAALDPEVSVASAGEGNSYGHPKEECVEVLEGAGSRFLCTKDVGDVEVRPGTSGPRVSCAKAPGLAYD